MSCEKKWLWSEDVEWGSSDPPSQVMNPGAQQSMHIHRDEVRNIDKSWEEYASGDHKDYNAAGRELPPEQHADHGEAQERSNRRHSGGSWYSETVNTYVPMICGKKNRNSQAEASTSHPDAEVEERDDEERNFMAVKPWLGAIYPPSNYIKDSADPHKPYFTQESNNWARPDITLDLDYVFGYRARDSRDNLHWVDETHVVFPAAAVGVVLNLETTDEDFFFGHDDDIVCLDYHAKSRLVASGSIGAQKTVRLCIWEVDDPQKTRHVITGFHQFAVVSVSFNPQGTLVASCGLDEHHSVALHSVETGALLAFCAADKNRLIHTSFLKGCNVDSNQNFVTIGVKHIAFWTPANKEAAKATNYFLTTEDELDRRLEWQRGFGCEEIDDIIFLSLGFSRNHTLAGASNGYVYCFHSVNFQVSRKVKVSDGRVLTIELMRRDEVKKAKKGEPQQSTPPETFIVGTGNGFLSFWDTVPEAQTDLTWTTNNRITVDGGPINCNLLDEATDNASDVLVNSVRSTSYDMKSGKLLAGTILSHLYSIDVKVCSSKKTVGKVLLGGHWGNLGKADEYGELWGIDAHPTKQWVVTCSDDGTLRLWDLVDNVELARRHVKYAAFKCTFAQDGSMIAVGHRNGGFTVLSGDMKTVVSAFQRDPERKTCVTDIQFSPNSEFLAVASEMLVEVHRVSDTEDKVTGQKKKMLKRIGLCKGHTSLVNAFDWNFTSSVIRVASKGYELLYFSIPDCTRLTGAKALADQIWFSQTCKLGWSVQGIWPRFADGTDINSVGKSRSDKYVTITDDWGRVKLFNYPCVGGGLDRRTGKLSIRPEHHEYVGHCSHVTNCIWTFDDTYLCTTGGADLCMFCWKVNYDKSKKPKYFFNAEKISKMKEEQAKAKELAEKERAKREKKLEERRKKKEERVKKEEEKRIRRENGEDVSEDDPTLEDEVDSDEEHRKANLRPTCYMCEYRFLSPEEKKCARCLAPRRAVTAQVAQAWSGKGIKSRFRLPTQSFARYTVQQQKQRQETEEKIAKGKAEASFNPFGSKKKELIPPDDLVSDSDEEIMLENTRLKKSGMAPTATKRRSKKKSNARPDFADY